MKRFSLCFFLILLFSCSTKKTAVNQTATAATILSECPKAGSCTVKIEQHKSMVVIQNENGIHYALEENPETNVVIYTYSKTIKGNVQDAGYREEIVFEVGSLSNLKLSDAGLQRSKMLFGRFCYCKDQTGYYKVTSGKLTGDQHHNLTLDFTMTQVPQLIRQIRLSLK